MRPDENKDGEYEFPENAKKEDLKENGWKFGWKPKDEDEDPIPEWPVEVVEEEVED